MPATARRTKTQRLRRTLAMAGVAVLALVVGACSSDDAATSSTSAPATAAASGLVDIGGGLQGPSGLTATTYATGLTNAAAFAFDAEGGLWVATAAFSDEGNDGVYYVASKGATPVKVISGLPTPLGLLWIDQSLYVSLKESVYEYSGFGGAEFQETHTVITFPSGVGEVNGIIAAPDGRIWLGISSPCDLCTPTSEYSAAVVSFLPDGTGLKVEASGIRAPIAFAYYPGTSDLFVTANEPDGLGDATPGDKLLLVKSGQSYGYPNCYDGEPCVALPGPVAVLDKHAAVSGIAIVTGELGARVGNAAIVAEWALGKVELVSLEKSGESYRGTVSTFLTGLQNPVPVIVTPDGAVLIGDWGTGIVYEITG